VFAGIALNGATLRPDKESNTELYGSGLTNRQIVMAAKRGRQADRHDGTNPHIT